MLAKVANPLLAVSLQDFRTLLTSWRTLAASAFMTAVILSAAWGFAQGALGSEEEGPEPKALWERGGNGALSALLFAVVPLVLPLLPVVIAYDTLHRDRSAGLRDLYLTQPSPKPSIAAGKVLGAVGGLAVVLLPLSLAGALLIQGLVGTPVDPGLLVAFVAFNMVLGILYLLLALFLGSATSPRALLGLAFLAWALFNVLRPTATLLFGQVIGLLRVESASGFEPTWTDLATFTGLYETLLASFVPAELGFVVLPDPGSALAWVPPVTPWAALGWAVALTALFALLLGRVPRH